MSGDISLEGARSFFADCSKPQDAEQGPPHRRPFIYIYV